MASERSSTSRCCCAGLAVVEPLLAALAGRFDGVPRALLADRRPLLPVRGVPGAFATCCVSWTSGSCRTTAGLRVARQLPLPDSSRIRSSATSYVTRELALTLVPARETCPYMPFEVSRPLDCSISPCLSALPCCAAVPQPPLRCTTTTSVALWHLPLRCPAALHTLSCGGVLLASTRTCPADQQLGGFLNGSNGVSSFDSSKRFLRGSSRLKRKAKGVATDVSRECGSYSTYVWILATTTTY